MNLGWIKGITDTAKGAAKTGLIVVKAHAPEILVGTGVVGFCVTVYEACVATNKAHDILDRKAEAETALADPHIAPVIREQNLKTLNTVTRNALIKAYLPVGTTGLASVILVLSGFKILNGRFIGVAAAYKSLEAGMNRYRGNVIDEFGEEVDYRMLHGIKKEDEEAALKEREDNKDIQTDNKKKLIGKKAPKTRYQHIYDKLFDEYSDRWKRYWNAEMMLDYLRQKENEMNDRLQINKHLFLNEVYDALGLERTSEGQVVGWILTKNNPNSKVSFGLKEMPESVLRDILSVTRNEDLRVWLHFNPDGIIYRMIDQKDYDICD